MEQEIKTQLQLEAHEKECAMFRELVHGKLDSLDKRMWRLEGNDYGQHTACGCNGGHSIYGNELVWLYSEHLNQKR